MYCIRLVSSFIIYVLCSSYPPQDPLVLRILLTSPMLVTHSSTTQEKITDSHFLDILGCLKNTHKNPKFGKVRQVPTREFPTKFPELTYLNILTYLHRLILAGYVPLASQNPYPIIGYSVANYRPHHSHLAFGQM